jgi:hypothetical protein
MRHPENPYIWWTNIMASVFPAAHSVSNRNEYQKEKNNVFGE